jgi:uncharacterized protein (DUF1697 family)
MQNAGMPTRVALLRGINVGGRNRVAKADLREVVLGLGHTEVATYIQRGNVVFTSEAADSAAIAAALERGRPGPWPRSTPTRRWPTAAASRLRLRRGPVGCRP